jgi:flagellar M-ring protein FliF
MASGLQRALEQARSIWGKLSPGRRAGVALAGIATVLAIGALSLYTPSESYAVLFTGLSPEDAGEVVEQLKTDKTPFQLQNGGGTVLVPEARVYELRLAMAQAGLPKGGGVGFEVFDQQSIATTSFVEKTNYQRALQGELARTIGSLDAVEVARVHLALGARSFFREEDQRPTASVTVRLRPGRTLSRGQVRGVVHLVASSVDGLDPERVTVVDERGLILSSDQEAGVLLEEQQDLERLLSERVMQMLSRVVGEGHVAVEVTAELDRSQTDRTENIYDKDKAAIRSEALTADGAAAGQVIGGLAGARGNLPGAPAPAPAAAPGANPAGTRQETRNYEVSHVITHTVSAPNKLKRLHVAVLVDALKPPKGSDAWKPEQLAEIEALARAAAGVEVDRGDQLAVRSVPFADPAPIEDPAVGPPSLTEVVPVWAMIAGGAGFFLLLVLLLRRRSKKQEEERAPIQLLPAKLSEIEAKLPESEPNLLPSAAPSARDRALEAARADSARAARVLSSWLAEEIQATRENAEARR